MSKCYLAVPHEENAPFVAPLVWWLVRLPAFFNPGDLIFDSTPGGDYKVSAARNKIVRRFLGSEFDWVWMVDSDMHPWISGADDNTGVTYVTEAMENPDVDILTGFYMRIGAEGPTPSLTSRHGRDHVVQEVFKKPPGLHHVPGLSAGGACLAVKRHVFEDMREKGLLWFRDEWEETDPERWGDLRSSEDTWFFQHAQDAGHKVWIDTRLVWGHIKPLDLRDELHRARELAARAQGALK